MKKIIDLLIFFLISFFAYNNPLFCLGSSSFFQEKNKELCASHSFLESLEFLNHFLENVVPKRKAEGLFVYWKKLISGKKNIYNTPVNKNLLIFIQELNKYKYHFLECLRHVFQYSFCQINENNSSYTRLTVPDYFNFNQNNDRDQSIEIKQFIKRYSTDFFYQYLLGTYRYKEDFAKIKEKSLFSFKKICSLFKQEMVTISESDNINFWKNSLNNLLLIIDQLQKNFDTEIYCHKLFQSLDITPDSKDLKFFLQYQDLLFTFSSAIYLSREKQYFIVAEDLSQLFSLSKKGLNLILQFINIKYQIDLRYVNSRKDFSVLLETLEEETPSYLPEEYTIGILLNETSDFHDDLFPGHIVSLIVHKKANEKIHVYSFNSIGDNWFKPLTFRKNIKNSDHYHLSLQPVQKTLAGCHVYSIYFLVMALQDMKKKAFDPQDIMTLTNSYDIEEFPLRWAFVCQSTQYIDKKFPKKAPNKKVVLMDMEGQLSDIDSYMFRKEHKDQQASVLKFFSNSDSPAYKSVRHSSLTKKAFYRNVLEKQASGFCIKTMIDALKDSKNTPRDNLNGRFRSFFRDLFFNRSRRHSLEVSA